LTVAPLGLYTDLYELTMAASFHRQRRTETVTFDLFVRSLPPRRDFLVVAGIDTAIDRLAAFTYDAAAVDYLATLGLFDDDFLGWLASFRFAGEVRAVLPGELAFAGEPIVTVTAPLVDAQLLETLLINTVGLETMIASKAARVRLACAGRSFVDFSARRDHGLEAALAVARASAVAGAAATSLVEAGRRYGLALSGTMAHSFVMAHDHEVDAFRAYLRQYGSASILLVDTYDTAEGVRLAVGAMRAEGVVARGVRIDSGDLAALADQTRTILDDAGLAAVQVLVSGDLDEDRIAELVAAGAPIDAFGVGTQLGTSADAPYLGMVYKLVEQGGQPRLKLSPGKQTSPGRKQVWRSDGADVIALAGEAAPRGARPLLEVVYDGGPTGAAGTLADARERCTASLGSWTGRPPVVRASAALDALASGVVAAQAWVGSAGA
jgi:nicotinate phosphoribosyltransferase